MQQQATGINETLDDGNICLQYQQQQSEGIMKHQAFEAFLTLPNGETLLVIACVGCEHNSLSFSSVWDETVYSAMMALSYNGVDWKASLFTTHETIDVSEIAKAFNGGGHRKAAGFRHADIFQAIQPMGKPARFKKQ